MDKPLYQTVIDALLARIASGEWGPGAPLPSEMQLANEMQVSQGTARKAVAELERRRIVERAQGRGSFVAVNTPEKALFSFFRLRRADGSQVQPVLEEETVTKRAATAAEAVQLEGRPSHVFVIERLRSLDGCLAAFETCVVPATQFPGLLERAPLPNTLYVLYQQAYNCVIIQADEKLRACPASKREADRLGVPVGTALMQVCREARDLLGHCVELRTSFYLTTNFDYAVALD